MHTHTHTEIVLSKNLPAASALATPTHGQGATPGALGLSPSVTSTPTPSLTSPGTTLSPLIQPGQSSPLSNAQIAAAFAQVKQATAALQSAEAQTSGAVGLSSPSAITSLISSALHGSAGSTTGASYTSPSHISSVKAQLHSHCPGQSSLSPLVKNMAAVVMPMASPTTSAVADQPSSSPQVAKSPATKFVTASKLPVSAERLQQLNSLLHTLQQKNSSLLMQLPALANGSTSQDEPSGAAAPVDPPLQVQTSFTSQSGVGMAHDTAGGVTQAPVGANS